MGKMKWKMIQAKDFCLWLFSYDGQGSHHEVWARGSNSEIVALHVYITDIKRKEAGKNRLPKHMVFLYDINC